MIVHFKRKAIYSTPILIWVFVVAAFYIFWISFVCIEGHWEDVIRNWEISLAMLIGSYAAGSTPMGGGSVGFPVLVMMMELPTALGRDFSFAIQSVGMVSASILILCRRQTVDIRILKGAFWGALIGTPVGVIFVSPYVDGLVVKILFSTIWASFGILHILRIREIVNHVDFVSSAMRGKMSVGFVASFISTSTVCGVTGVGVDMIIYCVLILMYRSDLKVAIPTSVIIMAFTSLLGVLLRFSIDGFEAGVFELWLAAAPVVVIGAPLGVVAVELIGRKKTLYVVATLCVGQFVWVIAREFSSIGAVGAFVSTIALVLSYYLLECMRIYGSRWAVKSEVVEGLAIRPKIFGQFN